MSKRWDTVWAGALVVVWMLVHHHACGSPAFAQDTIELPPGTTIQRPGMPDIAALEVVMFAVSRESLDECRSCFLAEESLEDSLGECVAELERAASDPDPRLGVEWVMVGAALAVGVAFGAGVWVGR